MKTIIAAAVALIIATGTSFAGDRSPDNRNDNRNVSSNFSITLTNDRRPDSRSDDRRDYDRRDNDRRNDWRDDRRDSRSGRYVTVTERYWVAGYNKVVWQPPVYETRVDSYGYRYQVLVSPGRTFNEAVPGYWATRQVTRWESFGRR